jgi:Holliday junction resolvase RusA-like endonuclease
VKFTIPGLPPSVNASHFSLGRRLKPQTRNWIEQAGLMMLGQRRGQSPLPPDVRLAFSMRLHGKWLTSKGLSRRVDLSNRIKILEDTVAKACGFDDSRVACIIALKVEDDNERTEVDVYEHHERKVFPASASL